MSIKGNIRWRAALLLIALATFGTSCSMLMQAKLLSVNIKVIDENDQPIGGAIVESSDGQQATTGADGLVTLKFSSIGLHMITVIAQDRAPATLSVTMPLDIGKTKTARLGKTVEMSVSLNISGSINFTGMLAGAMYPIIFQSMFNYGGYSLEMAPYKPGEWTEWMAEDDTEDQTILRKAFLKRLANGQEWWQLTMTSTDEDDFVMEVLFSKGRQSVRRLRQQMGEGEPEEVPVSEGWYMAPMALTAESMAGAVKAKRVSIKVPGGIYTCDILEFGQMGFGMVRMWLSDDVPGGLVKMSTVEDDGEEENSSVLRASGSSAKTILNSY